MGLSKKIKRPLCSEPVLQSKKIKSEPDWGFDDAKPKSEEKLSANKHEKNEAERGSKNHGKDKKIKFSKKFTNQKKIEIVKKKGKKNRDDFPVGKDGKPEWNKIKVEKKKLKEERKVQRSGENQYQLSVKAKSLWEKLRRKKLTVEKRESLVNEIFMLLKGQIPNVVHSHDMTRVVQWMLKLGSPSVRTSICEELCTNTVSYLQSKYACYCVKRALKYGSKTDRNNLIQSCSGHFLKLFSHTFASQVVELMYSEYATAEQRKQMHRELYGDMHVLIPPDITSIENIPENMRPAILGATKINLTKLLDKKLLLKFTLLQSVLNDFLNSCSDQDRIEILELIQSNILDLLSTKEGSKVALQVVWFGTNKMKKVIVKTLKHRVKETASSEVGYLLLMALFDCIDDTVLLKKALIPELLEGAEELVKNEWGRKVILYLVAHRDRAYFHPQLVLFKGDAISSRKKDPAVREQEMLEAVSEPLLKKIAEDPALWFAESTIAMVALAIMKSGKGEALVAAYENLVNYILNPSTMVEVNNRQFHIIEDSAVHLVLKKLIQHDKTHPDRTQGLFSLVLASRLTEKTLNHILQFNRGCFLLVLLFESNIKAVCKTLRSKISEPMKKFLQKQETTGSKILLKKLLE